MIWLEKITTVLIWTGWFMYGMIWGRYIDGIFIPYYMLVGPLLIVIMVFSLTSYILRKVRVMKIEEDEGGKQ